MTRFFEYKANTDDTFDPSAIVASCIENGHLALLFDSTMLPREFFDLSNGLTGELVHRLTLYGIRMAVIIPEPAVYSRPFQDFVTEANRGMHFHFAPTREEAIKWLTGT